MPKAPEPSSTCQKTTKSLPRISPKSYGYNAVPNRFLAHFSTSRTNGPHLLSRAKAGIHSPSPTGSHTAAYTAKQGRFGWGGITALGAFHTFRKPCVARGQNGVLCRFWALAGGALPKNAESLRNSDALMRVAVPRRRGPAGLRDLFVSDEITVFTLCAQGFPRVRDMGGITTLGVLCVLLKCRTAACKSG